MFESLVITLREGIEAALVIGIILAYISKIGRVDLKKYVFYGLGAAIAASVMGAVIFSKIGIDDNEMMEGILYLVAGLFVASMVVWMWKTSKNLKAQMEAKLDNIVLKDNIKGIGTMGWGIFAFTFAMVFREGIETVLFLAALAGKASALMSFLGAFTGFVLTVVFAILFIEGSLKINLQRFFQVTGAILLILDIRLFVGGLEELLEAGTLVWFG